MKTDSLFATLIEALSSRHTYTEAEVRLVMLGMQEEIDSANEARRQAQAELARVKARLALGALHATRDKPPADRVGAALEAAEAFSAGVRRPFRVEQTHNAKFNGG